MGDARALFNEQAEQAALGAMILEAAKVWPEAVSMGVTPATFYMPANRVAAKAIEKLMGENRPVDVVTLAAALSQAGDLERAGGEIALHRLVDACVTAEHSAYYLDLIRQEEIKRTIIEIAREVEQDALKAERGDQVALGLPERFARLASSQIQEKSTEEILAGNVAVWREARQHVGKPSTGIELLWPALTRCTGGLEIGLTILGGRPSSGKTTIEDEVAIHAAEIGVPTARWTLDTTKADLWARTQARTGGVSLPKLKFGYGRDDQLAEIETQNKRLKDLPVFINSRDRDLRAGMSWARTMKLRENIGLLTIDYATQIRVADMGRMEWDKVARTTHVAESLKGLALELGIPILLLAQLNRSVDKDGREPVMSDLRDSGALEQEANKIIFLYIDKDKRKEMDEKRPGATKHKRPVVCEVIKNKDGETGPYPLWFYPPYFRFVEAVIDKDGVAFTDDDLGDTDMDGKTGQAPAVVKGWGEEAFPAEDAP
jgi:replicative DNA helicase